MKHEGENDTAMQSGSTRARRNLNIRCTQEELDNIELIQNRINCAAQASRPDAIPDGVSEEKAHMFIKAAIESLAQYRWLEQRWWNEMKEKYTLPKDQNVWIDFQTKEFYVIE